MADDRGAPAYDRPMTALAYALIAAAASLTAALPHYAPRIPGILHSLEPVGNGIAGGAIAGSIAIGLYKADRRSKSREQKFLRARALVVDLNRIIGIMHGAGLDRFATGAGHGRPGGRGCTREHLGAGRPVRDSGLCDAARRMRDGLAASGGMLHLEAATQQRIHRLCELVEQGKHEEARGTARRLVRDIVSFRDANAPFGRKGLARPWLALAGRLRRAGGGPGAARAGLAV